MSERHSPFVIMTIAFIVAISAGISYYQFSYMPFINLKPSIPEEVLHPQKITEIKIIEGSFNQDQKDNFIPKLIEIELGVSNKVVWTNEDKAPHTVTTDTGAVDKWSGLFDSREVVPVIQPGGKFEFLFTQEGEFPYHCEPHPWMSGKIVVHKAKF